MLRIIFVTAYNVVNRSDLDQDDCIPLGRTVDTLARFWHALSRSTIYRDVTLNIIAISLPKISHATLMPNALDIEHDIVLGLPSHGSIEAMISLLRQKTFSSHSYDDNIKIVQWLTSDASMLLDIGLVVSALSTLMLRDCEFRSKLSLKNSDMGNPKWAWWCSTEFDSQIRDLPPGMLFSILSLGFVATQSFTEIWRWSLQFTNGAPCEPHHRVHLSQK